MSGSPLPEQVPVLRRIGQHWRHLARKLWREPGSGAGAGLGGPMGWRGLGGAGKAALLIGVVLAAAAFWQVGQGSAGSLPQGGILVLVGLVWVLAVAAASALPMAGFACCGLWLAWSGLALMAPWTGTPLVTLPVLWLLVVALALWAWQGPGRKPFPWLLWWGMSLGAGWLISEASGWNRLLGLTAGTAWVGKLLLGAAIAGLGIGLRALCRGRAWTEPSFGRVVVIGLGVMGAGLGASAAWDFPAAEGWAWGIVEASGPWASLGWFWLGGAFAITLLNGAEFLTRQALRGVRMESARWLFLIVWLGVTLWEWLATRTKGPTLSPVVSPMAAPEVPDAWPLLGPAAEAHAWIGVVVLVLGAGFVWQGRETMRLLPRLNALWMTAFPALLAAAEALPPPAGPSSLPVPFHWGRSLLLGIGGLWIMVRMRKHQRWESRQYWAPQWGAMTMLWAILLAVEFRQGGTWATHGGAAALLGMLHLALPIVLYRWWTHGRSAGEVLSLANTILLFAAGLLSVLPLLHRDPTEASQLVYCPVLWLSVLLWLRWRQPGLDSASGALAGALLGSAAVAAWCRPGLLLPEVPLFAWLNPPATALGGPASLGLRPFMDLSHFMLLILLSAAGAFIGALLFRGRPGPQVPMMPLLTDPGDPLPQSRMG